MNKKIRQSIFETNSSSVHAICISKDRTVKLTSLPQNILFQREDFGWGNDTLSTANEKANYLYEAIIATYDEDRIEDGLNKLKDILWGYGVRCEFEDGPGTKKFDSWTKIDHGYDTIEFVEAVMSDSGTLIEYLFGDAYVITGNDNDDKMYYRLHPVVDNKYGYDICDENLLNPEFDNYDVYRKGN